jgi:hypothetical protein
MMCQYYQIIFSHATEFKHRVMTLEKSASRCIIRFMRKNAKLAEWEDPPESLTQEEYDARLAAQIVEWEEHPEVYERWLRAHEPSKLWKELRAIKCKFMGLPYSDLDLE